MKKLLISLAVLVILSACSKKVGRSAPEVSQVRFAEPADSVAALESEAVSEEVPTASRKLIKTVDLRIQVDDTSAAVESVKELASEMEGYVSSLNAHRYGELLRYDLTLKVPVARLEEAVERIKAMAHRVDQEGLSTQDVTDQFVDLEARLRTLHATEEELQGLLSEARSRAFKASDVMAVYEQLTQIRTRIERIQGQLNQLQHQTALSTLRLHLNPTESAEPLAGDAWRPLETVRRSFRGLISGLKVIIDFLIYLTITVLPILVLILAPIYWILRRLRHRNPTNPPDDSEHE